MPVLCRSTSVVVQQPPATLSCGWQLEGCFTPSSCSIPHLRSLSRVVKGVKHGQDADDLLRVSFGVNEPSEKMADRMQGSLKVQLTCRLWQWLLLSLLKNQFGDMSGCFGVKIFQGKFFQHGGLSSMCADCRRVGALNERDFWRSACMMTVTPQSHNLIKESQHIENDVMFWDHSWLSLTTFP